MKGKNVVIIGGGSWGTALAVSLARAETDVKMWARDSEAVASMKQHGFNEKYLPGIELPHRLTVTDDMKEALLVADCVIFSTPAQTFRQMITEVVEKLPKQSKPVFINVAKGIEKRSFKRLSQIAKDIAPSYNFAVLSGPSHAEEVGKGLPTTLVVASEDRRLSEGIQELFFTDSIRVYISEDVTGVEIGGALKNIIALVAGIADGVGFGDNAKAALITRGLAEIRRLGVAAGARSETFSGLSGIGDLIVTCTSKNSRNYRCGEMIGRGISPEKAIAEVGMVVEGIFTTDAALGLADRLEIEMPITECLNAVLAGELMPEEAAKILMGREKKRNED